MFGRKATVDVIPFNYVNAIAFAAGYMVAAGYPQSLAAYKRVGDALNILPSKPQSSFAECSGVAMSADAIYMMTTSETSPFMEFYKREGDAFSRLTNPIILPTGKAYKCCVSDDGIYWMVTHEVSPFVTFYKRTGDALTKLSTPSTLPQNGKGGCACTKDGVYWAVAHGVYGYPPKFTLYKRSGDSFEKLEDPAGQPSNYGIPIRGCAFSPDASKVALEDSEHPYVFACERFGDTFARIYGISAPQGAYASGMGIAFSANGRFLVRTAGDASGYVYDAESPTLAYIKAIGEKAHECCTFSDDSEILAFGGASVPRLECWLVNADDLPEAAIAEAPDLTTIRFDTENEFSWRHIILSETEQTRADLQYRQFVNEWAALTTVFGDESATIIPANTFAYGNYQWRVRTYNQDGVPGEWSEPATFQAIGTPLPPLISNISDNARPAVVWAAETQKGYKLQILQGDTIVWDSGETAGATQTRKVPKYLANGEYKARVRIINASMLWSAWAEQEFVIDVTGPAKPTLTAEAITGAAQLTFAAPDAEKLYLLRDGIPIATVTGLAEYTDYAALGSVVYVLRAVDASDNYTDSDPVSVTVAVPVGMVAMLAAVDDLAHPVALKLTRGGPRMITGSKSRGATYHHYAGREYPVARYSGHSTGSYELSVAFISALDRDRLLDLLDRRRTMLYRDKWGNRWYVAIPDNGYEQDRIATSITLTMHEVDYVEQIDYEV